MTDLKPCPFCGGEAEYQFIAHANHLIHCTDCWGRMIGVYKEDIIRDWNRRVEE